MVTYSIIVFLAAMYVLDYLVFSPKNVKRLHWRYLLLGQHAKQFDKEKDCGPLRTVMHVNSRATRKGQVWRLFTPLLFHGGLWHLASNCVALLCVGSFVERQLGPWGYLLVLACGGIFSLLLVTIWFPKAETGLGASSAIYGAIGIVTAMLLRDPALLQSFSIPVQIYLLGYIGSNLFMQQSWLAHSSGFVCGIVMAFLLI